MERFSVEIPDQVFPTLKNCTTGARDQYFWTTKGREPGRGMGQISRTTEKVPTSQTNKMDAGPYVL